MLKSIRKKKMGAFLDVTGCQKINETDDSSKEQTRENFGLNMVAHTDLMSKETQSQPDENSEQKHERKVLFDPTPET